VDLVSLLAEVFLDDKISPGLQLLFPVSNQRAIKKIIDKNTSAEQPTSGR
jgi:hypothetical protein